MSGGKVYASIDYTLYVYWERNLRYPIASYSLGKDGIIDGINDENRLYLGGYKHMHVFEIT